MNRRFATLCAAPMILLLSSCTSPEDTINNTCTDLKVAIENLPLIKQSDTDAEIAPILTKQLEATETAQQRIQQVKAPPEFFSALQWLVNGLRDYQEAWANPRASSDDDNDPAFPGSTGYDDTGASLNIAAKSKAAEDAERNFGEEARRFGLSSCGESIQWR